eukprot:9162373-Prorocentrum_lima.AAC.1
MCIRDRQTRDQPAGHLGGCLVLIMNQAPMSACQHLRAAWSNGCAPPVPESPRALQVLSRRPPGTRGGEAT